MFKNQFIKTLKNWTHTKTISDDTISNKHNIITDAASQPITKSTNKNITKLCTCRTGHWPHSVVKILFKKVKSD